MTNRAMQIFQTAAYYVAFIALGMVAASLGPTLQGLAMNTGVELNSISFLFTARAIGYMIGAFQGGRLYDRGLARPVMAAGLLMLGLVMLLIPVIPWIWILTGALLMLGLAQGTLDVGGNALLVWIYRDKVGPYMNGLHFFWGVGAFLSPMIIAQVIRQGGSINWAYWTLAALILPFAAVLAFVPSPASIPAPEGAEQEQTPMQLVALIATFLFLFVGAESSFGGWVFTYTTRMGLSDPVTAAFLTSAFWGSLTLGRLLIIPLAARISAARILLVAVAGCMVSVSLVLLWPDSGTLIWVGAVGLGLSMAPLFPMALVLAEQYMRITGRITGWFFMGASIGTMSLPWIIGQLIIPFGPRVAMVAILANLTLALGVLVTLIMVARRGKPLLSLGH